MDHLIFTEHKAGPPCKMGRIIFTRILGAEVSVVSASWSLRDGRAYPWERDPTDYTFPYPWARLDLTPSRFSWEGNTKSKSEICFSSKSGQLLQSREEKIKLRKLFEVKEEEEIHSRC